MFVNSNENQARESDQVFFSIHKIVVETQTSQPATDFGLDTACPGFGTSGCDASTSPWLFQRMSVRRLTNKSSMNDFLQLQNDLTTTNLY